MKPQYDPKHDPKTWIKHILALYILKILQRGPNHGNKIAEEIKLRTFQKVTPNPNALYPLLRILEERGYVTGYWDDPTKRGKRIYAITDSGQLYIPTLEQKVADRLAATEEKISIIRKDLLQQ